MTEVVAVFADGGVVRQNPSPIGGTWACCHVDRDEQRIWCASGFILPSEVGGWPVTNNQTEFYALLAGLEALPDGWHGDACSDSQVTLIRFFQRGALRGIPDAWRQRMGYTLRRLDPLIRPVLLDGHPTRAQLAEGVGKRGHRVSEHNVWCDAACGEEGRKLFRQQTAGAA
jgi:ribonuclease HI